MSYEAVKRYRYRTRRKLILGFGSKCAICGLKDDDVVFDFHHLDPELKKFGSGHQVRSWASVVTEAKKCIMVCAHCHRKIHRGLVIIPLNAPSFDARLVPEPVALDGEPEAV